MFDHVKKIHFIGIGGVGVSAIARMARLKGIKVTGSDISAGKTTERIEKIGGKVFIDHKKENLPSDTNMIIYSPAITEDNPELIYGRTLNIPIYSYPEILGLISKDMYTIAISGAHGKTTTTSMLAELMIYGNLDPTVVVGGFLKKQEDNFVLGSSKYFIVEACEYKESFLNLTPNILVILNIDSDHLDYYENIENIQNAFAKLIAKTKEYIICDLNDENTDKAIKKAKKINQLAKIIDYNEGKADIKLSIPGEHNLKNAQAAFDAAKLCGIEEKTALKILKNYTGTWRRFEFMGNAKNGALLYNDYGHHPTEIKATLKTCNEQYPNYKLIVVFQPHLYSRTKLLLNDFAESFNLANEVIITDIYATREKDDHTIHSKDLVKAMQTVNAKYISSFDEIKNYLEQNTDKNSIILFLGAGDVYKIGEEMKK
ncbi:UDP-N-acetylmuramate--L-alanine ligase [Patescibacteria group bacterium]|nr:UDP-N-acetylmuramate--L-alanine ligase [Patescibacteria group bacterium]MBU4458312.1 UDP-N-acetylmuramate--L-alanine ligase [Patescibacteria group bacterium]MCG2695933.1 UDP-N-acetylmuramate--L-alanine ligase [Candidatus Portnoybacteria bacterium]